MTRLFRWLNCAAFKPQLLASCWAVLRRAHDSWTSSSTWAKIRVITICFAAFSPVFVAAGSTQDAERAGAALAAELRSQWPAENMVQTGWLRMRDPKGNRVSVRLRFEVIVTPTNWMSIFTAGSSNVSNGTEQLCVVHSGDCPGQYYWRRANKPDLQQPAALNQQQISWTGTRWQYAFAGSDFWAVDLGLEFFCWPRQRLLKREMRRSRLCQVLESINPAPTPDGYSRVVSWIDAETGGIVRAEAYDANNKLLKEFEPKEFRKVAGRWELRQMRIRNLQTGSQTVFELDQTGN